MKAGLRHCLKSCDSCFVGKVVSTIDGDCRTLKVSWVPFRTRSRVCSCPLNEPRVN